MRVPSKKMICAGLAAVVLTILPLGGNIGNVQAAQTEKDEAARKQPSTTTEKDQVDLSVTVYNGNLALVRDVRQVHLQSGVFPLHFEDVAASINPATVHFRSLTAPTKFSVVEQNYEYDLLDPQKLLQKYVGREVTLVRPETSAGTTRWVETKALLLANNGGPVWKIGNEIVTGLAADSYRFPDLPDNLYSQPTLVWTLDNRGGDSQRVEASYLASSMNWNADYVLTVARDEKNADLDGWVTLTNNSGAAYNNAKLQLVAGQVHRTNLPVNAKAMAAALAGVADEAKQQFAQEAFSEYHLYTLGRRTSIQNNESKQISLLSATSIPVEKYLLVEGQPYYFRNPQGIGNAIPQPVQVYYRFKNERQDPDSGMPLPAGRARLPGRFEGRNPVRRRRHIDHTPKDESLRFMSATLSTWCASASRWITKGSAALRTRWNIRSLCAITRKRPGDGRGARAVGGDWEMLNSNFNVHQTRFHNLGVFDSGGKGRDGDARLSRSREVVACSPRVQRACFCSTSTSSRANIRFDGNSSDSSARITRAFSGWCSRS